MTFWCITYTGPEGSGAVAGLKSHALAVRKAAQLADKGLTVDVLPVIPWYDVREQLGIPLGPKAAHCAAVRKDRQPRTVDATGTHRRLDGLMAIGWSLPRLEREGGFADWSLRDLKKKRRVYRKTAEAVTALYDRLSLTPPTCTTKEERLSVARAVSTARRNGYAPPMAWDDDTIDDPAGKPADPQFLDYQDRCRLARRLLDDGMAPATVVRHALVNRSTVRKITEEAA